MRVPPPTPAREAHPYLTHDMIWEIPQALEETLRRTGRVLPELTATLGGRSPLYLTGCGTAYFAALLGSQPLRLDPRVRPYGVLPAFELARYDVSLGSRAALVAVSHSGVTKATLDAVRRARDRGAHTVGISHFEGRPLQEVAHQVLLAGNGPDRSKCHTKCYVAGALAATQLLLGLLEAAPGDVPPRLASLEEGLRALPAQARTLLRALDGPAEEAARRHLGATHQYVAGAGPNLPTALETALKVKETSYLPAEGMETEEMLHGTWNAFRGDSLVTVVAPQGPGYDRAVDLVRAAKTVGAAVVAVVTEGDETIASLADDAFAVPAVDEYLSPFLTILPLYLFAYHQSVQRGHNPDELHYLHPPHWEARNVIFPPGTH